MCRAVGSQLGRAVGPLNRSADGDQVYRAIPIEAWTDRTDLRTDPRTHMGTDRPTDIVADRPTDLAPTSGPVKLTAVPIQGPTAQI